MVETLHAGTIFVVEDIRAVSDEWDFCVTGYDANGDVRLKTTHRGVVSMHMECSAWEKRGARQKKIPYGKKWEDIR